MKKVLYFKDGTREEFTDTEKLSKRVQELNSKHIEFNFQINSSKGREYFEDSNDFYSRLGELRRLGFGVFPLVRSEPGVWNSLNLHRKLLQLKAETS